MLVVLAAVFVLVYQQTGSQLRAQTDEDVRGDVSQLVEAARSFKVSSAKQLTQRLRHYIHAQPYSTHSSLLFAVIPGHAAVSNHPELLGDGDDGPDQGETQAEQARENAQARALKTGPAGQRTAVVPDLGLARLDEQLVVLSGTRVRFGAGESLNDVLRAQRTVAKTFLIAGAVGLALVLIAAYLTGALMSRPLRRMARVAARVNDGDLAPRMRVPPAASREIRVMAESFNHMLDRLALAFTHQRAFVADASHELRTPLTVISGQVEILASQKNPSAEELQRVARLVSAEIARTSRLVDDMLLLTRSEHADFLRRRSVDLPPFIADLWATTTVGSERRLELGPVPDASLDADPDRLAQALRNLVENALAHTTSPDGLVSLTTESRDGGKVMFVVADDGPGIAEAERERVFERFHRTDTARDRRSGGAGLGLSIVQAIATAHGGSVRAATRPGGGARLELELPGLTPLDHVSEETGAMVDRNARR